METATPSIDRRRLFLGSCLALIATSVAFAVVGAVTSPLMGEVADDFAHDVLPPQETVAFLETVTNRYPELAQEAASDVQQDIMNATALINTVLASYEADGSLPEKSTANALRAVQETRTAVATADPEAAEAFVSTAGSILGPADNYGGRISFRYIVPFTCLLVVIFGVMYVRDKKRGGYKVKKIREDALEDAQGQAGTSA